MKTMFNSVYSDLSDIIHEMIVFYPNSSYRISFKRENCNGVALYYKVESLDDLILKFDDTCSRRGLDNVKVTKIERSITPKLI